MQPDWEVMYGNEVMDWMDGETKRVENRLANRICVTVICNGHWSSINYNFNAVLNGNFTVRMPIKRPPSEANGSVPNGHF